jgi:hypothetical protein
MKNTITDLEILTEYVTFNNNRFAITAYRQEFTHNNYNPVYVVDVLGIFDTIINKFDSMQEVLDFITTFEYNN